MRRLSSPSIAVHAWHWRTQLQLSDIQTAHENIETYKWLARNASIVWLVLLHNGVDHNEAWTKIEKILRTSVEGKGVIINGECSRATGAHACLKLIILLVKDNPAFCIYGYNSITLTAVSLYMRGRILRYLRELRSKLLSTVRICSMLGRISRGWRVDTRGGLNRRGHLGTIRLLLVARVCLAKGIASRHLSIRAKAILSGIVSTSAVSTGQATVSQTSTGKTPMHH